MYKSDWMLRQIEDMTYFLARMLFNKEAPTYEVREDQERSEADLFYYQLMNLVAELKLDEAEDFLFERMERDDKSYLEIAIDFYGKLNKLDDEILSSRDFSREEIEEGLKDVADFYGVNMEMWGER